MKYILKDIYRDRISKYLKWTAGLFLFIQILILLTFASAGFFSKIHPEPGYGFSGNTQNLLLTERMGLFQIDQGYTQTTLKFLNLAKPATFRISINGSHFLTERIERSIKAKLPIYPGRTTIEVENVTGSNSNLIISPSDSLEYKGFYQISIFLIFLCGMIITADYLIENRSFPLFLFVFFFNVYFQNLHNHPIQLTGDEPHYLLQAQSIAFDFDTEVSNQIENKEYREYYLNDLEGHYFEQTGYSVHFPGLPALLSPVFLIQRVTGFQIDSYLVAKCIFAMIAAISACFWICASKGPRNLPGFLIAICTGLFMPFLAYSTQIYPEVILVCYLSVFLFFLSRDSHSSLIQDILMIGFAGILPFFHIKFAAVSFISVGILFYNKYRRNAAIPYFYLSAFIFCLLLSLVLLYSYTVYGSFTGPYRSVSVSIPISLDSVWTRVSFVFRTFFDADYGIFAMSPLLILSAVGLYFFKQKQGKVMLTLMVLLIASVILPNLLHGDGLLGACPVGRNFVGAYPVFAFLSITASVRIFENLRFERINIHQKLFLFARPLFIAILLMLSFFTVLLQFESPQLLYQPLQSEKVIPDYIQDKFAIPLNYLYWKLD